MVFPKSTRYDLIMKTVYNFFISENITSFPINPFEIIKKNKWGLITYSELAKENDMTIEEVIKACQSEDGYVIKDGHNYTIAYNDTVDNLGRIRFTLMHEIGHIKLNHLIEFEDTTLNRSKLTKSKYKILEREAHAFARNTLAPAFLVNRLRARNRIKSTSDLIEIFNISLKAAQTRMKFLSWDTSKSLKYSFLLMKRFKKFIDTAVYGKYCLQCSNFFVHESANYCPICGHKRLVRGSEVNTMMYDGYELDENGRPSICPRCENEHIDPDDEYCRICKLQIVNKCTNIIGYEQVGFEEEPIYCNTPASGDARYCVKCGGETTYLKQGLLKPWNEVKNLSEKNSKVVSLVKKPLIDAPLEITDEDLPF